MKIYNCHLALPRQVLRRTWKVRRENELSRVSGLGKLTSLESENIKQKFRMTLTLILSLQTDASQQIVALDNIFNSCTALAVVLLLAFSFLWQLVSGRGLSAVPGDFCICRITNSQTPSQAII